jgi:hypothetical protein
MFLEPKGLMKSSIASEVKVLARTADSLFDSDDPDVINSYSLELVMRRLYGFEKAFEFVEGEEGWRPPKGEAAKKWKSKVKWGLLDAFDLQSLEGKKLGIEKVDREASAMTEANAVPTIGDGSTSVPRVIAAVDDGGS